MTPTQMHVVPFLHELFIARASADMWQNNYAMENSLQESMKGETL